MYIGLPTLGLQARRAGSAAPTSAQANAQAWADAVTLNGGTFSQATLDAVAAFCVSALADGYWTKLLRINLFAGNQLAAAQVPLKVVAGNAVDTIVGYVESDYTEATGLTGATGKYLRTGVIPSTMLTLNNTHLSFYLRGSTAVSGIVMGVSNSTDQRFSLMKIASAGSLGITSFAYNTTNGAGAVGSAVLNAAPWGLITGSRVSAVDHKTYLQGTMKETNAGSGGTLPTFEIYFNAYNNGGAPGSANTEPMGAYSIGAGLTGADMTAFSAAMTTFQTALGRNV